MEQITNGNTKSLRTNGVTADVDQISNYMERPRLQKLLEYAMHYRLVVLIAGSGYGKTRAVDSFLSKYDANITWYQFSERDNVTARFWESYANMMSKSRPEFKARMMDIGFPETDEAFAKFSIMVRELAALPGKQVQVFDDIHLSHNPVLVRFCQRSLSITPPNTTVIVISRTTPELNLINLMLHDRVFLIQEDTLCFSENEIAEYFNQLRLQVTSGDVRNIYDDTQGWAFAINLIARSLAKKQKYERYAIEAMKKNIFRLIEAEIAETVSQELWRFLLRISLIDHLAANLIKVLARDIVSEAGADALIAEMERINAYIRYDFDMDAYMIHHLFLDYLRQKHGQLSDEEKRATYQTAGVWCEANGYQMDSFSYYEKSGDYNTIMQKVALFNVQVPLDVAQYVLDIFDHAPETVKSQNPIFPAMYLKLKISLGQFAEVLAMARTYAEDYETRPESPEKNRALTAIYAIWGLSRMDSCTYTDVYDFDIYFKKMSDYFNKSPFQILGAYTSSSANAWASLVGTNRLGAQEEYLQSLLRTIPYVSRVLNGCLIGFDDLVRGELCFYRGEFTDAEQYLKQSVDKAQACNQFTTHSQALAYLMQLAFFHGDFTAANAGLQEMNALLCEKDNGIRYTMYDIVFGFYQLALYQPEQVPEWLKGDFSSFTHPSYIENYGNRVKARYHYQTSQYSALLAFIENAMGHSISPQGEVSRAQPMILFGKIELKVLQALSFYHLKRRPEAIAALTEAYHLAESNKIIVTFIQHAKDMRTLSSAALKDKSCKIPKEWLEDINRKSSSYAKRKAKVISEYRAANNLGKKITLSPRESAVLKDLSQGLSRVEIASSRNLSINTVKMVINHIYYKLGVFSLPEAIRVAVDHKII
ncbi:MAG: LuxR C-terminal-related transcriptional regulator [Treponema sp.]|nr:LuxR C-terminal-related transcriptional regulator [Treponema sp.]